MTRILTAAVAGVCVAALASGAWAANDKAFLTKAMKGDNSEMALGAMAQQRGASSGVKSFGAMLHQDHAQAKQQAAAVARKSGVPVTDEMADEAKQESAKLKGLSGHAFDAEFARYMVEDHKKDIADFEAQSKSGDAATRALAAKTLPTLRKHLATAEQLQRSL